MMTTTSATREKRTDQIIVKCKPEEKRKWLAAFADGDLSRAVRDLLNRHEKVKAIKA